MTEIELAYFAGLIDGEGCITAFAAINKRGVRATGVLFYIGNTNRTMLRWVEQHVGGEARELKRKGAYQICYKWTATGDRAVELLTAVLPYLTAKKSQALVAIELYTMMYRRGHGIPLTEENWGKRLELVQQLKDLKRQDEVI